jgi:Thioesterase-like superfamily
MTDEPTPFFATDEHGRLLPNDICRGPWDPNSLHGRVLAAALAHEMEMRWALPGFRPARLTVDMYRMPTFAAVEVTSEVIRDGNRIRIVDAQLTVGGVATARASGVFLRETEQPDGTVWSPPGWQVPGPDELRAPGPVGRPAMWETRVIDNGFGSTKQKRAWLRETRQLVENVPLTPFVRAAFASDFTNPFADSGSAGLQYVNADITLYLQRLPAGEWLGFEVVEHHASDGIAVGECVIYDEDGPVGRSVVCGLANRRKA